MEKDPVVLHIQKVAREWLRAWASLPEAWPLVRRAWPGMARGVLSLPSRRRAAQVKGPGTVLIMTLAWIGWEALEPDSWRDDQGDVWKLSINPKHWNMGEFDE
eukprot:9661288-Lingulodinium_polyedra.AAC.1